MTIFATHTIVEALVLSFVIDAVHGVAPRVVQWNTTYSHGSDGPWQKHPNAETRALIYAQAITVSVGTNESGNTLSSVDLYPGSIVESIILAQDYCSGTGVVCQAALAGLITVDNSTISAVHREYFEIPSGFSYTPQVGTLSLLVKEETVKALSTTSPAKTLLVTLLRRKLRLRTHLVFTTALLLSDSEEVLYGVDTIKVESLGKSECSSSISPGDLVVPLLLDIQIGVENGTSPAQ